MGAYRALLREVADYLAVCNVTTVQSCEWELCVLWKGAMLIWRRVSSGHVKS